MEAEAAVRSAFNIKPPHNKITIPDEACRVLNDGKNGRDRVYRAIDDMVRRGALNAPAEPWKDWTLLT